MDEAEVLKLLKRDTAADGRQGGLDRDKANTGTLRNLKRELAENRNAFEGVRLHALQAGGGGVSALTPTQSYELANHQKYALLRKHVSSLNRILDRVEALFLSEYA